MCVATATCLGGSLILIIKLTLLLLHSSRLRGWEAESLVSWETDCIASKKGMPATIRTKRRLNFVSQEKSKLSQNPQESWAFFEIPHGSKAWKYNRPSKHHNYCGKKFTSAAFLCPFLQWCPRPQNHFLENAHTSSATSHDHYERQRKNGQKLSVAAKMASYICGRRKPNGSPISRLFHQKQAPAYNVPTTLQSYVFSPTV